MRSLWLESCVQCIISTFTTDTCTDLQSVRFPFGLPEILSSENGSFLNPAKHCRIELEVSNLATHVFLRPNHASATVSVRRDVGSCLRQTRSGVCVQQTIALISNSQVPRQRWLLTDWSDPGGNLAHKLGARQPVCQRLVLHAKYVGNACLVEKLAREAQGLCPGPRLDVHQLKAVLRSQVEDLEELGDHCDNETRGGPIGDHNVRVLVRRTKCLPRPSVRLPGQRVHSVDCRDDATEDGRDLGLVHPTGSVDLVGIKSATAAIRVGVSNECLEPLDHVEGTVVARGHNVAAVLYLVSAEFVFDGFNYLSAMSTRAKDIKEVNGWEFARVRDRRVRILAFDPAAAGAILLASEDHVAVLKSQSVWSFPAEDRDVVGQEVESTYDDKTKHDGNSRSNPGEGEIEERADSQDGGSQNTEVNGHGIAVLAEQNVHCFYVEPR